MKQIDDSNRAAWQALARRVYEAYWAQLTRGNMPDFDDLPVLSRDAWAAAARTLCEPESER